ncbi:hypothetical protein [Celerinatantimonas diazotrophica]|uniref:DUF2383 domain-containing protein n=1 Tax=Celerinatantimonas diazotrophica TaxID=412034 RepID=A0A4R1J8R5_9GAMM|nr:hypothetical protein [Celerinatantimonas diazotrophica]TCK46968.1 hypothetical protein EV690_3120 [Celerinatantimonas diazotrophica]CAG9295736.1 hypothetical protein CEDIAZO_00862 [Celerinatantimonas diazotrophica]
MASHDTLLSQELFSACQSGMQFYQTLQQSTEQYVPKKISRDMFNCRDKIMSRLNPQVLSSTQSLTDQKKALKQLRMNYQQKYAKMHHKLTKQDIFELLLCEQSLLNYFRLVIRKQADQSLARELASYLASLQLTCDQCIHLLADWPDQ